MKVLVIGSGGREHAICWKLKQSPLLTKLYCAPGNPGIEEVAELVALDVSQIEELLNFAKKEDIDLTIVGPELPLTLGIVDRFQAEGLKIFGPEKEAAKLEGSKVFAKEVMLAVNVPTGSYKKFTDRKSTQDYLASHPLPLVLKADGLAAGKGVFVCLNEQDLAGALESLFDEMKTSEVLVEEFLVGVEASYIVATDGTRVIPMASSHDYKRAFDDDQGLNTGGMGSVSPTPRLTAEQETQVIDLVIKPMLDEMKKRGINFKGFLYAGLMINSAGEIKVLEFNVRFGDPETQSILRRLDSDLLELIYALEVGSDLKEVSWSKDYSVCVVLAAQGYPGRAKKGDVITGIDKCQSQDIVLFQAGTKRQGDAVVTNGGRVLSITSNASTLGDAISKVYDVIDDVQFEGAHFRKDIGM